MIISPKIMSPRSQVAVVSMRTEISRPVPAKTIWQRALVSLATSRDDHIRNRSFILHTPSGELYLDEPSYVTRIKCALIALSAPFFATYRTLGYLFRSLVDMYVITMRHMSCCTAFSDSCCDDLRELFHNRIVENLSQAAVAPVVMIGALSLGAIGVIAPWQARRIFARMEKTFSGGRAPKDQFTIFDVVMYKRSIDSKDLFPFIKRDEVLFQAPCFQQKGLISDSSKFIIHHMENI